jgi:hypothetical protein
MPEEPGDAAPRERAEHDLRDDGDDRGQDEASAPC